VAFGETVVRIRAGASPGLDRYRNPLPGVDTETPFDRAGFDPGGSREPVEVGRTATVTTPKVYFLGYAPDIVSTDRLRVRGLVYQVQGRPAEWRDPYAGNAVRGVVVELELAEG
jgi:hypothetical protein